MTVLNNKQSCWSNLLNQNLPATVRRRGSEKGKPTENAVVSAGSAADVMESPNCVHTVLPERGIQWQGLLNVLIQAANCGIFCRNLAFCNQLPAERKPPFRLLYSGRPTVVSGDQKWLRDTEKRIGVAVGRTNAQTPGAMCEPGVCDRCE